MARRQNHEPNNKQQPTKRLLAEAATAAGRRLGCCWGCTVGTLGPHLVNAVSDGLTPERQALCLLNDLVVHTGHLRRHHNMALRM